jgi:threonine/homoserine/homoserine lactone efflux protein
MFGIADYGAFVVSMVVFLCIPGPGNLAVITSTTKGGVRGGFAAMLGIMAADQVLLWLAVAGVAAVLAAHPTAFALLQSLGAGYLVWLGWRMVTASPGSGAVLHIRARDYFEQAMFITLLNPKAVVFYMAFLPLFIDPDKHQGLVTFAALALTAAVLALLYCIVVIVLTHYLAERLRSSPVLSGMLNKLAGICLIGFGVKLAFSR